MNELILEDQPLEVLTELAKGMYEECQSVLEAIVSNEKRLQYFGRVLTACRKKVPHGEWESWLQQTFGGSLNLRTARRWIADYSDPESKEQRNSKRVQSVKSDTVAEMKPQVQVIEPGLKEEPRINTKHTPENAKAKESEKPAPRPVAVQAELVQKVTNVEKLTLAVSQSAQEIGLLEAEKKALVAECERFRAAALEEKTLSDFSIREIGEYLKESAEEPKERAKWLRKLADELDPPTPKPSRAAFTPPSVDQVREYVHSINGKTDPETFCDFYTSKDWLVGKVKMKDWKAAVRTWEKGRDNKQGASALRGDEW